MFCEASWKKRRRFFENYAKEQAFDPLVAENWYLQPRSKIMAAEVSSPPSFLLLSPYSLLLSLSLSIFSLSTLSLYSHICLQGPKWVVDYHKGSLSRALQKPLSWNSNRKEKIQIWYVYIPLNKKQNKERRKEGGKEGRKEGRKNKKMKAIFLIIIRFSSTRCWSSSKTYHLFPPPLLLSSFHHLSHTSNPRPLPPSLLHPLPRPWKSRYTCARLQTQSQKGCACVRSRCACGALCAREC